MFKVGQKVHAVKGTAYGKVVYVEDDLIYIETSRGVEMEFNAADLMPYDEYVAKLHTKPEPKKIDFPDDGNFSDEDKAKFQGIVDYFGPDIMGVAKYLHRRLVNIVDQGGLGTVDGWDELSPYHKLNYFIPVWGSTADSMLKYFPEKKTTLKGVMLMKIGELAPMILASNVKNPSN